MEEFHESIPDDEDSISAKAVVDEAVQHVGVPDKPVEAYAVLAEISLESDLLHATDRALFSIVDALKKNKSVILTSDPRAIRRAILQRRRRFSMPIARRYPQIPLPVEYDDRDDHDYDY